MALLSNTRLQELLQPFAPVAMRPLPTELCGQLSLYLDLLVRWNGRTNLTAVREPEEMVTRHFGESLFAAWQLQELLPEAATLLDYGSGAGFPGLPMQLALPGLKVTLAEAQGKKAAFLREAIRVLGLPTTLWARRAEQMPPEMKFDIVAMRAVDKMEEAVVAARGLLNAGGRLLVLGGVALASEMPEATIMAVPESTHRKLIVSA